MIKKKKLVTFRYMFNFKIVEHVHTNIDDSKILMKLRSIKRLKKNFNANAVVESSPGNKYTSYSINKEKDCILFKIKDEEQS